MLISGQIHSGQVHPAIQIQHGGISSGSTAVFSGSFFVGSVVSGNVSPGSVYTPNISPLYRANGEWEPAPEIKPKQNPFYSNDRGW